MAGLPQTWWMLPLTLSFGGGTVDNGGTCTLVLSAHFYAEAERYLFTINAVHHFMMLKQLHLEGSFSSAHSQDTQSSKDVKSHCPLERDRHRGTLTQEKKEKNQN